MDPVPELVSAPIIPKRPVVSVAVSAPMPTRNHVTRPRNSPEPISLHNVPFPGPWAQFAACRGVDTDQFFPRRGQDQTGVMEICAGCGVQVQCRDYALTVGAFLQGIWGGLNERQRRRARADRREPA